MRTLICLNRCKSMQAEAARCGKVMRQHAGSPFSLLQLPAGGHLPPKDVLQQLHATRRRSLAARHGREGCSQQRRSCRQLEGCNVQLRRLWADAAQRGCRQLGAGAERAQREHGHTMATHRQHSR